MADPEGSRKLMAILAADAAGYSRLMQIDDRGTVATLDAYRAIFREHIEAHEGRIVDMAGDSILAVFDSPTEAVRAAFEITSPRFTPMRKRIRRSSRSPLLRSARTD